MPRWVKVLLWVAVALVALLVVLMLFSGGQHGPWRHMAGTTPEAMVDPCVASCVTGLR